MLIITQLFSHLKKKKMAFQMSKCICYGYLIHFLANPEKLSVIRLKIIVFHINILCEIRSSGTPACLPLQGWLLCCRGEWIWRGWWRRRLWTTSCWPHLPLGHHLWSSPLQLDLLLNVRRRRYRWLEACVCACVCMTADIFYYGLLVSAHERHHHWWCDLLHWQRQHKNMTCNTRLPMQHLLETAD